MCPDIDSGLRILTCQLSPVRAKAGAWPELGKLGFTGVEGRLVIVRR